MPRAHPLSMTTHYLEGLQAAFDRLLEADAELADLVAQIQQTHISAVIFGGWVRDHTLSFMHRVPIDARDIDIVVHPIATARLEGLLPAATKNIFGGFACSLTTLHLDIWRLEDTYFIAKGHFPPRFDILPLTTVFRINFVVFGPRQLWSRQQLYQNGFFAALEAGVIDFQYGLRPFPALQVWRAVLYGIKLGFALWEILAKIVTPEYSAADSNQIEGLP
jgi:hypothetical protein